VPRAPRRVFALVAVAAVLVLGVITGGLVRDQVSQNASSAPHVVAVVANLETPDQIRRLRRTTLLNTRKLPHEITAEPV
jgi:hypothetical protein